LIWSIALRNACHWLGEAFISSRSGSSSQQREARRRYPCGPVCVNQAAARYAVTGAECLASTDIKPPSKQFHLPAQAFGQIAFSFWSFS
jgi:hypothetical protein